MRNRLLWIYTIILKRKIPIMGALGCVALVSAIIWIYVPRKYESSTIIQLVKSQEEIPRSLELLLLNLYPQQKETTSNYVKLLKNEKVIDLALELAKMKSSLKSQSEVMAMIRYIQANTTIVPDEESGLITVSYTSTEKENCMELCDQLYESLHRTDLENRKYKARESVENFRRMTDRLSKELSKLSSVQQDFGILDLMEAQMKEKEKARDVLIDEVKKETNRLEVQLRDLLDQFNDNYYEVRTARARLDSLNQIFSNLDGIAPVPESGPRDKWELLRQDIGKLNSEINELRSTYEKRYYEVLQRASPYEDSKQVDTEIKNLQEAILNLEREKNKEESKMETAVSGIRQFRKAYLPTEPSSPKLVDFLKWALISFFAVAGVAIYGAERLDSTLRTPDEVFLYTQRDVIIVIPYYKQFEKDAQLKIVFSGDMPGIAEPFRMLRTNLLLHIKEQKNFSLLVTSSAHGEGKTFCVANLGYAFAEQGKKVILLSTNIKHPTANLITEEQSHLCIEDAIENPAEWRNALIKLSENFHLIKARGTDNSSLVLSKPGLDTILTEMKKEYDVVLLDSPPLALATDALLLVTKVDHSILIYALGTTEKTLIRRSLSFLDRASKNLMGIVVNSVSPYESQAKGYYYYYYGKSGAREV